MALQCSMEGREEDEETGQGGKAGGCVKVCVGGGVQSGEGIGGGKSLRKV